MSQIMQVIIAAITSSGVMSLIIYLLQRHDLKKDKENEKDSIQNKMLLGLAHDRILQLTDSIIKRGVITSKEKTNLKYLYFPYRELGGNGDCETGYDVCNGFEVVTDEVANRLDIERRKHEFSNE